MPRGEGSAPCSSARRTLPFARCSSWLPRSASPPDAVRRACFINDRADVALAVEADGVQRTHQSLPVSVMRAVGGPRFIVGASVHSVEEARTAATEGADFIVFGPICDTPSKRPFGPASRPRGAAPGDCRRRDTGARHRRDQRRTRPGRARGRRRRGRGDLCHPGRPAARGGYAVLPRRPGPRVMVAARTRASPLRPPLPTNRKDAT